VTNSIFLSIAYALGAIIFFYFLLRIVKRFFTIPAPAWFGPFLDTGLRKIFQDPEKTLRLNGIQPGMQVLEIGCGSGAFTVPASRILGNGFICGLDIQEKMLKQVEKKMTKKGIRNIKIVHGDACKLPFEDNFFDMVFMVTVLPEIKDKATTLSEARRVLKPSGIFSVSEMIFDPDYLCLSTIKTLCTDAGFEFTEKHGNFLSYTANFVKGIGRKEGQDTVKKRENLEKETE